MFIPKFRGEWLRILQALIALYGKTIDAILLRSQNPDQEKLFADEVSAPRLRRPTAGFLTRRICCPLTIGIRAGRWRRTNLIAAPYEFQKPSSRISDAGRQPHRRRFIGLRHSEAQAQAARFGSRDARNSGIP